MISNCNTHDYHLTVDQPATEGAQSLDDLHLLPAELATLRAFIASGTPADILLYGACGADKTRVSDTLSRIFGETSENGAAYLQIVHDIDRGAADDQLDLLDDVKDDAGKLWVVLTATDMSKVIPEIKSGLISVCCDPVFQEQ